LIRAARRTCRTAVVGLGEPGYGFCFSSASSKVAFDIIEILSGLVNEPFRFRTLSHRLKHRENLGFRIDMGTRALVPNVSETAETTVLNACKLERAVPNRMWLIASNTQELAIGTGPREIKVPIQRRW
jgi:hypothetical protein